MPPAGNGREACPAADTEAEAASAADTAVRAAPERGHSARGTADATAPATTAPAASAGGCPGAGPAAAARTTPPGDRDAVLRGRGIVIVGCRGRMGAMLCRRGRDAGLDMRGVDVPLDDAVLAPACADAALAILCVPAAVFAGVAATVSGHLPATAILADITSVKVQPLRQMEELWPGPVVGTHPLFGPATPDADGLPVTITPGRTAREEDTALVEAFFRALGCATFRATADEHDRAMARIQNMNFITNLAYFALLAGQEDLLPYITPSFRRRLHAAEKMLTEDGSMFTGLFEANPYSHEAVRQYRKMLNVAAAGDIELLCRRAQWWWKK